MKCKTCRAADVCFTGRVRSSLMFQGALAALGSLMRGLIYELVGVARCVTADFINESSARLGVVAFFGWTAKDVVNLDWCFDAADI